MSERPFLDEWLLQNDYLRQQLLALARGPRSRWRKFRLLEWVCASCGETVLEVMDTAPYRVIHRRTTRDDRANASWSFHAIAAERDESDDRRVISTSCRCQTRKLPASEIWDDLDARRPKRVLSAFHERDEFGGESGL